MATIRRAAGAFLWIEQETSIHLKACTAHGDPVELTADDARELARELLAVAEELDSLDAGGSESGTI